jgi:predicted DsbA family dithiol-disulfide isomerase
MHAKVWSDYICPWAYVGRDRTALLRSLGVTVESMPYELHPEIPPEGRTLRPDGRMAAVHQHIARLCEEAGLAFLPPSRVPNSRRALETAEVVRQQRPDLFDTVDAALFDAHFVVGLDIGDPDELDRIVSNAGASAADVRALVDAGAGQNAVTASMAVAHGHGIAATPAWLFGEDFVLPGAQPRELFERIVARLRARRE